MSLSQMKYGPYALITGASVGLGEEFANQLAREGFNLILVARRRDKLDAVAARLKAEHKISVHVIDMDLMKPGAAQKLEQATADFEIGFVILNAGIYGFGAFLDNELEYEESLVQLNVMLPMQMAHIFGRKMAAKKRGGILLVGSSAGFQALPYTANYSASKAYVLLLGEALNYELKAFGVDVMVLAPGMTKTEGTDNMRGVDMSKMPGKPMAANIVVREALRGFGHNVVVIPGIVNQVGVYLSKYMPRKFQTAMVGKALTSALTQKPGHGDQ